MSTEPTWTLSDGTVVRLGGLVEGQTRTAELLRRDVQAFREGRRMPIPMFAPPAGSVPLELGSVPHVDCWVRDTARFGRATVVSGPEFERLPDPRGVMDDDDFVPDRVY